MMLNYTYINSSKKQTILFVHGIGANQTLWTPYIKHFSKKYNTLAVDLPSHGRSKLAETTIDNSAKSIDQILKKEKITNYIAVGHCIGANIITKLKIKPKKYFFMCFYAPSLVRFRPILNALANLVKNITSPKIKTTKINQQNNVKTNMLLIPFINLREICINKYAELLSSATKTKLLTTKNTYVFSPYIEFLISNRKLKYLANKNHWVLNILKRTNHMSPLQQPQKMIEWMEQYL